MLAPHAMIAKILIRLPFTLSVPMGLTWDVQQYEIEGYRFVFYPPGRTTECEKENEGCEVKVEGHPALQMDVLHVDVLRNDFNRSVSEGIIDPPLSLLEG